MPPPRVALLVLCAVHLLTAVAGHQEVDDPLLRATVERFFATQEQEDVESYLALWSKTAKSPPADALKYIFASGDDRFSDIRIVKITREGDRARVRVSGVRQRTQQPSGDGARPRTFTSQLLVSLTFVREGDAWMLVREGPASDDLAQLLMEARTAADRQALMAADSEFLDERVLTSMGRMADGLAQQGRHADAQTGYERMLEVARYIKNRKYEGEALQNLGNARYFQRHLPEALAAYEARLAIEREREDDGGIAAAFSGIATVRYAFAEYSQALAAYREALAIQERLGDAALIATSLISTGNVLYLQGDFAGAIADYSRSRELNTTINNRRGAARALEGLGRVYLARGDLAGALEAFAGVLDEAAARADRVDQGNATLNLGEVQYHLGNLETARKTFEASRSHFEAAKDVANTGRVWQAIALVDLVVSRFELAEEEYARSRAICSRAGDDACAAAATAGLAFTQTVQEKYRDAIANYGLAIDQFRGLNAREQVARAQIGLADALSGSGDHAGAIKAATDARQGGTALDNDDLVWRALIAEARALRALDRRQDAIAASRAAVRALDNLIEGARSRPAFAVPRETSSIFALLGILHAERGDPAAAFEAVERMRVHDLRLGLAKVEREISRGMTPQEREEERALAMELVSLHAQLGRARSLPKPDRDRIAALEQKAAEASERRLKQQEQLFARVPELRIWRGLLGPATAGDLAAVLQDGDLLLHFVVDDRDVLLLAASKAEGGIEWDVHVRPVARRSVADRVAALMQMDVLSSPADWRRASGEFLKQVVPSTVLERLTRAKRTVLIPHEVLWRIPFEALSVRDRHVGDYTDVAYAPSITALARVPAPGGTSASPDLLTVAAPEVPESVRTQLQQLAPGWTLRDAHTASNEVKAVAADAPPARVIALEGSEAGEPAVRHRLGEADIIHLAVPFRVNGASPLFSPLLLSGEPLGTPANSEDDGRLEAREIINAELRARVAVLSDGSALTMREAADDAVLVQWAWRAAGVPSLLLPRWTGDVETSEMLLVELHARLRAGENPGEALRAAQASLRRSQERAAPYYWAGWLLIGG